MLRSSSFQLWQNEEMSISGPKIPQALEKILQLKDIRQEQLTDVAGQNSHKLKIIKDKLIIKSTLTFFIRYFKIR